VLITAILLVVILVFSLLSGPAAEQARKQETSQTTAAQHTAPHQEASEAPFVISVLAVFFQLSKVCCISCHRNSPF
jgi:hypothetical protein